MRTLKYLSLLLILVLVTGVSIQAQNGTVTLTLSIPRFQEDFYKNTFVPQFEAANPGIKIYLVTTNSFGAPVNPDEDVDDYLDDMEAYVSSADVLLFDSSSLTSEATRAGYLLDLAPLVNADATLNPNDFYPAVWRSVQWDGGIWGLPVSVTSQMLYYSPAAFDAAGLAYPDASWTLNDFAHAVRALAKFNPDGTLAVPGMLSIEGHIAALALSLIGEDLVNDSVIPNVPDYSSPNLETLLTTWAELEAEGVFGFPQGGDFEAPLSLGGQFMAVRVSGGDSNNSADNGDTSPRVTVEGVGTAVPTLLPGNRVIADVNIFGISSGTQYPDAAYTLLKYLTSDPGVASNFFGGTPARRSLAGVEVQQDGPGIRPPISFNSPEVEALIQTGLENALVAPDLRFASNLSSAVAAMVNNGVDARTALNDIETEVLSRLQAATDRRATTQITVADVPVAPTLNAGEISFKFGATSSIMPMPGEAAWKQAAADFAALDPEVGFIELETDFPGQLSYMTENYDCFYLPTNAVQGGNLSLLRSLDPLMSTDPNFNANDLVNGALPQVQVDNQTWMYPITVQPASMRYNRDLFAQAGVIEPNGTWTVQDFEQALRTLKTNLDGSAPFVPRGFDSGYLLSLIASYGGLPVDYRTSPPTINFTDPATVEAVRQVLNLAKEGYIAYQPLSSAGRGGVSLRFGDESDPIYTEIGLGGASIFMMGSDGAEPPVNPDPRVSFPAGSQYTPVTYDLGGGYISAATPYAEACYRFLGYLAKRFDLFSAMPASLSVLNDPAYTTTQSADTLSFYTTLAAALSQANTVVIPAVSPFNRGSNTFELLWLTRAFDRYVEDDADLDTELAEAQTFTQAFQECTANPPAFDADNMQAYYQFFLDCATRVDPTISQEFGM